VSIVTIKRFSKMKLEGAEMQMSDQPLLTTGGTSKVTCRRLDLWWRIGEERIERKKLTSRKTLGV
jgi:hypothetical protein